MPAGAGADRDESLVLARTAGRFPRRSARAVAATPEGFARSMTHGVGTTCWLAPELIKDNTGTETIDVYAFGIVLWKLATREEATACVYAFHASPYFDKIVPIDGECGTCGDDDFFIDM